MLQRVVLFTVLVILSRLDEKQPLSLKVLTVATEKTDGYRRFMRYAQDLNISVEVSVVDRHS